MNIKASKAKHRPLICTIVLAAVLCVVASVGAFAKYIQSQQLSSNFTIVTSSSAGISDDEILNDGLRKLSLKAYDYPVYTRAAVSVNWQSDDNTISASAQQPVEGDDYTLEFDNGWVLNDDGYYYYTKPVSGSTDEISFIKKLSDNDSTGEDSNMVVSVAVEVIQAVGTTDGNNKTIVEDAWGVQPENVTNAE